MTWSLSQARVDGVCGVGWSGGVGYSAIYLDSLKMGSCWAIQRKMPLIGIGSILHSLPDVEWCFVCGSFIVLNGRSG